MLDEARVAIVTGSSRGIGAAIARQLAKDGYDIALNDIDSQRDDLENVLNDVMKLGRRGYIVIADVSLEQEVKQMIEITVNHFGAVDVMVANAGILAFASLLETTLEEWDRLMDVNARGVFLCYKYAAQAMIARGKGGRIIGASSLAGKQGNVNISAYSASKFAVRGLTQCAALELAKYGITVNAYAPGPIDNTGIVSLSKSLDEDTKAKLEAMRATEIQKIPVGFLGQPEDVAKLVSYLASKDSGFITGQTVSINGGQFFD